MASPEPSGEATVKHATRLIDAGEYAAAFTTLDRILEAKPDDFEAMYWYATALYRTGRNVEAEAAFRRLVGERPEEDRLSYGLALSLLRLGRRDEARTWLGAALAVNPTLDRAREKLAELGDQGKSVDFVQMNVSPEALVGQAHRIRLQARRDPWIGGAQIFTLTFRVDRVDESGNPLPPVSVRVEGPAIHGEQPAEGDWVEVAGRWERGGALRAREFRNLTTNEIIQTQSGTRMLQYAIVGLFVVTFIVFAAWGISANR